jgi:hypothetical protein
MSLQQCDLDRLLVAIIQYAGAFAEHFHGTGARAGMAERIGVENDPGRAAQIPAGDFLDERGHVDVRGASDGAGRIVAEQALVGLEQRRVVRERRSDVGEIRRELLVRQWHRPLPAPCSLLPPAFR